MYKWIIAQPDKRLCEFPSVMHIRALKTMTKLTSQEKGSGSRGGKTRSLNYTGSSALMYRKKCVYLKWTCPRDMLHLNSALTDNMFHFFGEVQHFTRQRSWPVGLVIICIHHEETMLEHLFFHYSSSTHMHVPTNTLSRDTPSWQVDGSTQLSI